MGSFAFQSWQLPSSETACSMLGCLRCLIRSKLHMVTTILNFEYIYICLTCGPKSQNEIAYLPPHPLNQSVCWRHWGSRRPFHSVVILGGVGVPCTPVSTHTHTQTRTTPTTSVRTTTTTTTTTTRNLKTRLFFREMFNIKLRGAPQKAWSHIEDTSTHLWNFSHSFTVRAES